MRVAKLTVKEEGSDRLLIETYKENDGTRLGLKDSTTDVQQWAQGVIDYWNNTLRAHDKVRTLISVEVTDDGVAPKPNTRDHEWTKTSLVTVEERGRYFDRMKCSRCGITGKRFGLTNIKRDSVYRAKKYELCK